MAENGDEKLIAVSRHIAKTLGHTDTDDILKIFSDFDGRLRENLSDDQIIDALDRQLSRYVDAPRPICFNSADLSSFLDSVDQLISAVRDWTPLPDEIYIPSCLHRAEDLLQRSMFRLHDEFTTLAESFDLTRSESAHPDFSDEDEDDDCIPVAHPITDYDIVIDALPAGTIGDLNQIANRMVAAGYAKECSNAYTTYRRDFLEESLSRLGLQKLSADEIDKWIKVMNVAFWILFPSEKQLCDRVFFGFSSAADFSFMEICRDSTIQLLNFADAVASGSRAPDRLFKVLDVYETMRDLMPEFELIFSDQYSVNLRNVAISIWERLGEAIRGIFMELENSIHRDPAKYAFPGGRLHPITRYVVNYLRASCRARNTLEQVFEEIDADRAVMSSSSPLTVQMVCIMDMLESNLEAKSKLYRDFALCSVFLMNNGRYIVNKVKDTELGMVLGEDWIRKHTAKLRQYHVNYQRSSWSKVLGLLKLDTNNLMSPNGKSWMENLKLFNEVFEDTCNVQSSWVMFDDQLRDELRASVSANLAPTYRGFIGRILGLQDSRKNLDRCMKYSVEDIEARIGGLFEGSSSGRR